MSKKIVIYLISTLLFITGCNKNNEINESLDTKQDNISSSSEEVSLLEPLSEDGEVIQNAAVPKSEGFRIYFKHRPDALCCYRVPSGG